MKEYFSVMTCIILVAALLSLTECSSRTGIAGKAENTQVENTQAENAQAENTQAENTQVENMQTKNAQAENAQAENRTQEDDVKMKTERYEADEKRMLPNYFYTLERPHEVDGRQGIAYENGLYYVSGSTTLSCYDQDWKQIQHTDDPFADLSDKSNQANHIGDIDVFGGKIYAGVEYFMDGEAKNIQIALYDAKTLKLDKTYPFDPDSGQTEVSGITVDPDNGCIWMCSWADDESGKYLYAYDLKTGKYMKKVQLLSPPRWIQGIAYLDGWIYITSDDGDADLGEADHIYRCKANPESTSFQVVLERTMDDVTKQGEIEGISFDTDKNQMLICYNRGARIIKGMPSGFYEGYDREIHEIFIYNMMKVNVPTY